MLKNPITHRHREKDRKLERSEEWGRRGDLYVRLIATLPPNGDPRVAELAKEMQGLYGDENVRAKLGVTG